VSAQERFGATVLQAWNGSLDFSQLLTTASALERERQWPLVALLYQAWLKRNASPYKHAGYFNLGAALSNAEDPKGAEEAYREAIALAPGFVQPRLNLGLLYERSGQIDKAINEWDWIEQRAGMTSPGDKALLLMAINHLGRVTEAQKRYDKALAYLTKSLMLDPDQPDVLHHWVYLRERQCAWPVYQPLAGVGMQRMKDSTSALAMLNISDDPAWQLEAARQYVSRKLSLDVPPLADRQAYGHERIRIAYCSSDFSLHPVSMLTAQLYELHDRGKFEVHGYCWSPEDGSARTSSPSGPRRSRSPISACRRRPGSRSSTTSSPTGS
jgi:predicted O-linked N-acetylglucosamine transferase (SPINDLY family)